jgi:large subunit ribosomal protein L24
MKVRVGDTVEVMVGKDRGRKGKIERVFPAEASVVVEKVNRVKRHLRKTRQHPQGGITEVTRPVPVANVMVLCPHCSRRTRVSMKLVGDRKVRLCRRCGKALDEKKGQ